MANLKAIRIRIASVKSTRQITSAMKMVSAAKLRKAQDKIVRLRPFANKLHDILDNLSQSLADCEIENIYGRNTASEKILIVAITSNRGLCGAFNTNVIREAKESLLIIILNNTKKGMSGFLQLAKRDLIISENKNLVWPENSMNFLMM